jgi:hypothetical protein
MKLPWPAFIITAAVIRLPASFAADKSHFTLFNPTPRDQLRELSTDRPDQTESPYTVDAGHWQFEFDFANFTTDDEGGTRTQTLNIAPLNAKLGLTSSTDLQLHPRAYPFFNHGRRRHHDDSRLGRSHGAP